MPERMSEICQKICQKECQKICQKECQKDCQELCQKICQNRNCQRCTGSLQTWFLAWSLGIMGRELGKVPLKNLHIRSGQRVAVEEATRTRRKTRKEEEEEMRLT